mgnify:CR=1 FL=1
MQPDSGYRATVVPGVVAAGGGDDRIRLSVGQHRVPRGGDAGSQQVFTRAYPNTDNDEHKAARGGLRG